jgi:CRP-like cAMP-binding protein
MNTELPPGMSAGIAAEAIHSAQSSAFDWRSLGESQLSAAQNHLIEMLPRREKKRLLGYCELVQLELAAVLHERGSAIRLVYFPVDAFISLVTQINDHPGVEVGMVGREGMVGASLALGVAVAPWRALVQGSGSAWRIGSADFRRELALSPALQRGLNRYLYVLMAQQTTSAACLRFHAIAPRVARWLLMSQDRAHADHFRITHEFMAYMLGVRRVGITVAASALQREGLIEYHRGEIRVLDRAGLEAAACSCYAADRQAYSELLD